MKKHTDTGLRALILLIFFVSVGGFVVVKVLPKDSSKVIPTEEIAVKEPALTTQESFSQLATPQVENIAPVLYYSLALNSTSTSALMQLEQVVGQENIVDVLKLNRIDAKFLKRGSILTVPQILGDFNALSPYPRELPLAESIPKLLWISRRVQAFGVYESGKLVRWGPVSTGTKSSPTPAQLYSANWKDESVRSSVNYYWILPWTINILNHVGIDIHQYDLPGYPASHSCVRTVEADAVWLFNWIDLWITSQDTGDFLAHGTPIIIFGDYAYGETAPWKNLPHDPTATNISLQELETELSAHMDTILERQEARDRITGLAR